MLYQESAERMPDKNQRDENWHLSAANRRSKTNVLSHHAAAHKRLARKMALYTSLQMCIQQRRQSRQWFSFSVMPTLLLLQQMRRGAIVSSLGKPHARAKVQAVVNAELQSPSSIILARIRENALKKLGHTLSQSDNDRTL